MLSSADKAAAFGESVRRARAAIAVEPVPSVAELFERFARLIEAQRAGRKARDAETLTAAARYLRTVAGDQE
jgi:hypothetical protein